MSRTTIGMLTVLVALGCVVAWLPAQESSRRTAMKNRPSGTVEKSERPSLAPLNPPSEENLPPIVSPPGRAPSSRYTPVETQSNSAASEQVPAASASTGLVPRDPAMQIPAATANTAVGVESGAAVDLEDGGMHSVLKRPKPAAPAESPPAALPAPATLSQELARRPAASSAPPATSPDTSLRAMFEASSAGVRSGQNVSATAKSAALKVDIAGPQGVTVGKPAPYVVTVSNESDTAADEVQLRIALPNFVTVNGTQPTSGEAAVQGDALGNGRLVWNVPRIAGRSREQLKLQLVTRDGDSFDLGVEWVTKPQIARAAILVKQPQLALSLAGPADMTFGEEKTFTLTVSNPGTGDAERVTVSVSTASSPPQQFDAGTIPAGHKKDVPLAVVASQAGSIELAITASAEGGLEAKTAGKINVRKAEVSLAIEGPPLKYAGSEASYLVTVSNNGNAAADNVSLTLALPNGARYLGGIEGSSATASGVKWKISSLAPASERQYEVRLQLSQAGLNRVAVQSQAAASGIATAATETEVEAISELKLVVNDPSGPTATGENAVYELQVMNRGSQSAKQVKIVMQFSDGLEPQSFEGCEARIVPGQVLCQPLAQLGPGEQATLRVKAKAQQAGTHQYRIEVTTTDGDARLVSEGTTRFFTDAGRGGSAASTARKPSLVPGPSVPTTLR